MEDTPNKLLYVGNLLTGDYVLAKPAPAPVSEIRYVVAPAGSSSCAALHYVFAPVASSSCAGTPGGVPIQSKEACANAAITLGRKAVTEGSWDSSPGGCIWDQRNEDVLWNEQSGSANVNQGPICRDKFAVGAVPVAIESKEECDTARLTWGRKPLSVVRRRSSVPAGCTFNRKSHDVYWNTKIGDVHPHYGPICATTGGYVVPAKACAWVQEDTCIANRCKWKHHQCKACQITGKPSSEGCPEGYLQTAGCSDCQALCSDSRVMVMVRGHHQTSCQQIKKEGMCESRSGYNARRRGDGGLIKAYCPCTCGFL